MQQQQIQATNWSQTLEGLLTWGFTKLTSRKFWAAAITAYALWLQGQYQAAGAVIAAYVGIEGTKDIVQAWGEAKQKAAATATETPQLAAPQPSPPPPQPQPTQPAAPPAVQPAQVEPQTPWEVGAFHHKVLEGVETKYTVKNPATVYYFAKELANETPAADLKQVRDFASYLLDLATSAQAYIEDKTKQTGPCATESEELATIRQSHTWLLDNFIAVQRLIASGLRLTNLMPPPNRKMMQVLMASEELATYYLPNQ